MADTTKNTNLRIVVDDGYLRVPIENEQGEEIGVFRFNPTDIGIIERYNRLADTFDAITDPLNGLPMNEDGEIVADASQVAEPLAETKERLYAAVDELFGGNAAEAFFGQVHPFSPVNGEFYCERVLRSVGEFISQQFEVETKKLSARVKKYTAQRKAKK